MSAPTAAVTHLCHLHVPAEYGALKPKRREGGGDLASRLHMSKATRHDTHQGEPAPAVVTRQPGHSGQWKKVGDEVR